MVTLEQKANAVRLDPVTVACQVAGEGAGQGRPNLPPKARTREEPVSVTSDDHSGRTGPRDVRVSRSGGLRGFAGAVAGRQRSREKAVA